jgi:hypothetical protein
VVADQEGGCLLGSVPVVVGEDVRACLQEEPNVGVPNRV